MAPQYVSRSAPTTPQSHGTNPRTPSSTSKHRPVSLINRLVTPSPCAALGPSSTDHPVEVVARIREHPEGSDKPSVLQATQNGQTVRIRTDQGYRDFGLDGVSLAESEDLPSFYKKYVESRIESVKSGGRCTIMMYGPTGAGKSHTMFGSSKEPGIAYRALQDILGGVNGSSAKSDEKGGNGSLEDAVKVTSVVVTILEIYNEEIFDLLAGSNIPNGHWTRPDLSRARLEVMGKKAKNAVSIAGTDAEKISREIAKVEKRRVIKSTLCNERSSRSHCLVMLDVPCIGGRLVLVDMAGSENLEQAGLGIDSKLQTGKINQGNIALKRVVEAIANGDSYIPFRDSKLTMLLQDSFEDDGSKILMILCASPDPKDMHKTIGTLEYGCKAKCIVALPASPAKERSNGHDRLDPSVLEARVQAMDVHISKLEAENQSKDKEKEEIFKELKQKEQDFAALQQALEKMEQEAKERCSTCCNEELRAEMEERIKECQRVAEEFVAMEKKKLEEKVAEQQREIDCMRSRMKEIEREVELFLNTVPAFTQALSKSKTEDDDIVGKVKGVLDSINMDNQDSHTNQGGVTALLKSSRRADESVEANNVRPHGDHIAQQPVETKSSVTSKVYSEPYMNGQEFYEQDGWLPIIPEEESEGEEEMMADVEEIHNELQGLPSDKTGQGFPPVMQDGIRASSIADNSHHQVHLDMDESPSEGDANNRPSENGGVDLLVHTTPSILMNETMGSAEPEEAHTSAASVASRRTRIENIFLLCGNHRELAAATHSQKHSHESHCDMAHGPIQMSESPLVPVDNQMVSQGGDTGERLSVVFASSSPATTRTLPTTPNLETSGKKAAKGADKSPAHFLSTKTRHPFSENTPPHHGVMPSYSSPSSAFSAAQYSKSPAMSNLADSFSSVSNIVDEAKNLSDAAITSPELCDVYVKWETSKDSSGRLITVLKMNKNLTLAQLRAELENRVADVTNGFTFLMLGDPSGNPVERENETCLSLTSLPDCHKQRGTKLACLRPHLKRANTTQGPLCSLENQMTWNSPKPPVPSFQKSPFGFSLLRPMSEADSPHEKANQTLSLPLISQMKGIRL